MENFENISRTKNDRNNDREKKINSFLEKKINSVNASIKNSLFNLENPLVQKKIENSRNEALEKFFPKRKSLDPEEEQLIKERLERKIIKISLEKIAEEDLGGSLSFYEDLEKKYIDTIYQEGIFLLKNNSEFQGDGYYNKIDKIKILIEKLNNKNLLNKDKKTILFENFKNFLN